ncbi:MAG TPA: hypothetical protein VN363_07420, partial [Anaerolineales bacterium]|nr:hypothetical protein [Anaerolineales bacterium]
MLSVSGKARVADFLGDRMVYRNLNPADGRLAGFETTRRLLGLPSGYAPRKSELDYARVVYELLQQAQHLQAPGRALRQIVFIGDTRRNDGLTFDNLCQVSGLPGTAFIGDETTTPVNIEVAQTAGGRSLYLANRWEALLDPGEQGFRKFCQRQGLVADEGTVLLVDLDKTALAARGRNARVIDQVRIRAVENTVAESLGASFDPHAFRTAYDRLNQPEFHSFTADNQDYLAYICLILGSGIVDLDDLVGQVLQGSWSRFADFIEQIEARAGELGGGLADLHTEIYTRFLQGDPTPFKAFRRKEYLATIHRMGCLGDDAPLLERME